MYSAVRGRHRLLSSAVTANLFLLSWCEKAGLFQRSLRNTAERAGAGQTVSVTPRDVEKENVEGRGREGKGKKEGGTRVRGVDDAKAGPGMPSAMAHAKTAENSIVGVPKHGGAYMQYNAFGNLFEVSAKYVPPIHIIGRGAYGVVCSALNTETGEEVAIKKIANAFDNKTDAKRTLREIKLLLHMDHENVIAIRDIIRPPQPNNFNDVYIVYELMDTDLHQIIRSNQPLSEKHCQYFLYQLLRGLKYIHSLNVLHRDLKPNNLFLNGNCDLKIGDFGLARTTSDFDFMTEYVVTRWYRAPELLLNCNCYTAAIDVWSVGCIFMELLNRTPLFPGRDYVHQLKLITELIGSPDDSDLGFLRSDTARRYMNHLQKYQRQPFGRKFPNINPTAVDLIERMLVFDPYKRITVEQALSHPYLESLHDINDEPSGTVPFEFDFEQPQFNEDDIKELIMAEALGFNPIPDQKQDAQVHAAEGMDTLP